MQKAIVVQYNEDISLMELNQYLKQGWVVTHTCAMPSSPASNISGKILPTCLVIIEGEN
jgi:hypothetical protein